MNIDEFLTNEPSINFNFEVINDNPDYLIFPEEKNKYYITYYDIWGSKTELALEDIWGFYDGFGIFISHDRRPYELLYLGAISILRYEHYYNKDGVSKVVTLSLTGMTTTSVHKINDVYLDLKNDTILPRKRKQFERLISKDMDFYNNYKKDRKTDKQIKPMIYLQKYNRKYPLLITKKGIELSQN